MQQLVAVSAIGKLLPGTPSAADPWPCPLFVATRCLLSLRPRPGLFLHALLPASGEHARTYSDSRASARRWCREAAQPAFGVQVTRASSPRLVPAPASTYSLYFLSPRSLLLVQSASHCTRSACAAMLRQIAT